MQKYREGQRCVYKHEKPFNQDMANAIMLPPAVYTDVTALLMGDPPVGRRALDRSLTRQAKPEGEA